MLARYHVVGAHGGAWIYEVESHEEFERLLAVAPVFNFARYTVHPLADMSGARDDGLEDGPSAARRDDELGAAPPPAWSANGCAYAGVSWG